MSPLKLKDAKLLSVITEDSLNGNIATPNRAKRNLNESFDYTPQSQSDTPILNYSVVEYNTDEGIKLTLKVSEKQMHPVVLLDRLNLSQFNKINNKKIISDGDSDEDSIIEVVDSDDSIVPLTKVTKTRSGRMSQSKENTIPVRRSSRCTSRVSYNEYLSPRKTRLRSCDSDEIYLLTPRKKLGLDDPQFSTSNKHIEHGTPSKAKPVPTQTKSKDTLIDTPSKLGLEKMTINTPSKLSPRKRPRKQNLSGQFTYTPSKRSVYFQDVKEEEESAPESTPAKRNLRRSSRSTTNQTHPEVDDLVFPIDKLKFTADDDPPKTPEKSTKTPKSQARTPGGGSRLKLLRNGEITPSMKSRRSLILKAETPLDKAKQKLHVSYVPQALPCREKEFEDIYSFVEGKLVDGCGGCMYISGVPGTGKTATVTEVIRQLEAVSKKKKIPNFTFISINGMRLTEPRQSYVEILKQLTGKTVPWEQAQSQLDSKFTKTKNKLDQPIVMLIDELDILCTKRQDVVYNLLDWPTKAKTQLIVITIANTMDLPERLLMGRVTSRLGLTRLTFQAYNHKQLQEIVMKRLVGTNAFNPDAVQLVARKVASVSGDARRALDICRRAAEIAGSGLTDTLVTMQHVNDALNAMITQPKVLAIKQCSRLEQLLLQAVAAEVERTGVDETTFNDVYMMLASVAGIDGFQMVSITTALCAVARLGASRLLLTDQKKNDLHQRLLLNVSADDIYYALRKD